MQKSKTKQSKNNNKKEYRNNNSKEKELGNSPSPFPCVIPYNQISQINHHRLHQAQRTPPPAVTLLSPLSPPLSHEYIVAIPLLTLAGWPATMTCEGWDCKITVSQLSSS